MISKKAAGEYALRALPSRYSAIVRDALAGRNGEKSAYRNIFARRRELLEFMEYVIAES